MTLAPPQDMADSRRINANIREEDEKRPAEEQPPFGVYAVILSSEFWPPFKDEKLEVPEDIRAALEAYCKKYEQLKVPPCRAAPWALGTPILRCRAPSSLVPVAAPLSPECLWVGPVSQSPLQEREWVWPTLHPPSSQQPCAPVSESPCGPQELGWALLGPGLSTALRGPLWPQQAPPSERFLLFHHPSSASQNRGLGCLVSLQGGSRGARVALCPGQRSQAHLTPRTAALPPSPGLFPRELPLQVPAVLEDRGCGSVVGIGGKQMWGVEE